MTRVSYQTIKLTRGKHQSPEQGACVLELASMLAGEPFSDHPGSVSRPIASFLRAYNDRLDDQRRQSLYEYASKIVGTAASSEVEDQRALRLLAWAESQCRRSSLRRLPLRWRLNGNIHRGPENLDLAGCYAVKAIGQLDDALHAELLALVDELIVMTESASADAVALGVSGPPEGPRAGVNSPVLI
jgi:hypothetical protein